MSWQLWPKTDERGLARYVLPEAAMRLPIGGMPERIPQDPASRLALVQAIYTALADRGITYRAEDYQTDLARQSIRHPDAILDGPKVGTCLDLAVLFSGLCLWHDLLPVIVVLDDHAFVAVSLRHNRRDWDSRTRMDRALFVDGVLRGDAAAAAPSLLELIDEAGADFLPIECTGFSRAADLSDADPEGRGRENGVLPFSRAIAAAREHLGASRRRLLFAIDVAALHYTGYQPPPPWGDAPGRADIQVYTGASAQRLNYRQETADIIQYYAARFVGREAEQQAVFDFCGGVGPFADRAYLLIEAPGGLGKSALMVHLLMRATTGHWGGRTPHVLFFFVRRQGGRNTLEAFLRALNSQLLNQLGVSGGAPLSLTDLKAQFTQLWDAIHEAATPETPLLILIDGLDEMAVADGRESIADLLPAPRNPAVRIVVSSRPQPSARDLGRREHPLRSAGVLQLKNLDRQGVQLLFEQVVANPPPAGDRKSTIALELVPALSERVFTLTSGEPLFARAVCEQLAREGPGALDGLERNPPREAEDYFRLEIATLRDSDVSEEAWQILGLLTAAVGPLSRDELASLSQVPPRRISKVMAAVMRYLLGEQRYELMHPRLRDLLTSEFSGQERADHARRIIEWIADYRERGWPDDTPLYLLDYGAAHLAAAGRDSELYALIDRRWMERQRQRDGKGELTAFVRDVSRATATALNPGSREWMAAFKGTYVLATVRSLASSLPPRLIAFLARAGAAAEALSYAELVEDPVRRCEVCARLAAEALSRQDQGEARRLVTESLVALTGPRELLGELDEAYEPLCHALVSLRDTEGLNTAHRVAEQMVMDDWRAGALALVASACSQLMQMDRAIAIVASHRGIKRFLDRTLAIAALRKDDTLLRAIADLDVPEDDSPGIARRAAAWHLLGDRIRSGDLAVRAIALAARPPGRVAVWASLVTSFQQGGMAEHVEEVRPRLLARARQAVRKQDDDGLEEAAAALALTHDSEGLVAFAAEMAEWRDEAVLSALAGAFARAGEPARAREITGAIGDEDSDGSYESLAWLQVVQGLVDAGLLDAARDAALDNRYESRVQGLALVVDALSRRDGTDTVMTLARRVVADASGLTEEFGQAEAYASLARLMEERGDRAVARRMLDRAEAEVAATPPGGMVLGTSRALATAHARLGAFDRAADRLSSWRDDAPTLHLLLGQMRAIGPSAAADSIETLLHDLIANATEHQTLLVGAEIARAAGDPERMRELLDKARAAAVDDELSRVASACAVVKAMAASGETDAARRLLETIQVWPEWARFVNEQPSDRHEAGQGTAAGAEEAGNEEGTEEVEEVEEGEGAEQEGEDGEPWLDTRDRIALAQAFECVGDRERSDELFESAIAMARSDDDYSLGVDVVEAVVRYLARAGTLADRVGDIVAIVMRQTHDWQKAQQFAAGASAAMSSGQSVAALTLLGRALDCAASGGRSAFFEILGRFSHLASLGVADIERQLFEMCEGVDAWWLPDGVTTTAARD